MTEKNPWDNNPRRSAENIVNPSQDPNAGGANPETTVFPPANGNQPVAPWNANNDFGGSHGTNHQGPPQFQGNNFNDPNYSPVGQPQYQQTAPPQRSPNRKGGWMILVIIVLALIALALGVMVFLGQSGWINSTTEADEEPVIVTEVVVVPGEEEVNRPAPSPQGDDNSGSQSRPSRVTFPANAFAANSSARMGNPDGDFNNVYTGSSVTSEEFARQVRSAFVDFYYDTGQTSGSITAYSPVTGLSYSMDCSDNGSFVTCAGGNNAVVYIS